MSDLLIPDVSEFQSVDFSAFSGPIIVRAHNGFRGDNHWPAHAAGAAQQPWWGAYQYLPQGVDPAQAALGFLSVLGNYKPNVLILDLEEGIGDQSPRQHAWLTAMTGHPTWTYTGDYFARAHGVSVDWVAAYQRNEPTTAHRLWQFSDKQPFPGIGPCDGSVFHGSINDLLALTSGAPAPRKADDVSASANLGDNIPRVFVIGKDGQVYINQYLNKWSGYAPIGNGGNVVRGLSVSPKQGGGCDLYAIGPDDATYHCWWAPGAKWSAWENLGGQAA